MGKIIVNGRELDLEKVAKEANVKSKNTTSKERHASFIADALEVSGLSADIEIQPATSSKITVTAFGPEDIIDQLTMVGQDGAVIISGSKSSNNITISQTSHVVSSGGNMQISGISMGNFGGGVTIISGDDITIRTGDDADTKISLKITAPLYTELSLSDIDGDIKIGNLQSYVDLDLSCQNSVHAANVHHLRLDASGQCAVVIEEITGSADLDLSGSSSVELHSGYAERLDVDASGMCKVNAQITAKRANLDASGMSMIHVQEVIGRCHKNSSGMSQITVG